VIAKAEMVLQIDISQLTIRLPAPVIRPAAQALIDVSRFPPPARHALLCRACVSEHQSIRASEHLHQRGGALMDNMELTATGAGLGLPLAIKGNTGGDSVLWW
jgi:hypothetical protein